ncbi:hypothetical protein IGI37_001582 [Enterococcus sp. AZ194]|uniref:hypothetical protein n=1 Tax=Enterococcus sp. AZ194 TaxID=2774629 RepID=UPI003F271BA0
MKKRNFLTISIVSVLVTISIVGYFVFLKNRGPYADIAGEWKEVSYASTEDELDKVFYEIEEQLGDFELQTLRIDSKGNLSLHSEWLDIMKNEDYFQLPKKRASKQDRYPLEAKETKIEESPLFNEYLETIFQGLAQYGTGPDLKKQMNIEELKEIIDEKNYTKSQLAELTKKRQQQLSKKPEMYKNIVASDNLITYETQHDMDYFIQLIDKDTIKIINKDKENVVGTYTRK